MATAPNNSSGDSWSDRKLAAGRKLSGINIKKDDNGKKTMVTRIRAR